MLEYVTEFALLNGNLEGTCCVVGGGGLLRPFLLLALAAMTTAAAMRVMVRTAPTRTTNMKDGHPSRVNSSGFELLSTTEKCKKNIYRFSILFQSLRINFME